MAKIQRLQPAGNEAVNDPIQQWLLAELRKYGEPYVREDGDVYYRQDGLLDSMSTLKFMVAIQKQFHIVFSPEQFNSQATATLRELAQLIAAALPTSN